ncbi:PREDICTED: uncharacterized protein LOC104826365 [Tarenaya hassleriana]|uniref:uncharacterized protein LOC104826365 n=1 Tax=Tarenaya hassleriana TaxID=28532 RepID=UPI00053C122A|nr:PREDICTED: uncharacterized protein LOC104826365 [Tarenaya hassleriana]
MSASLIQTSPLSLNNKANSEEPWKEQMKLRVCNWGLQFKPLGRGKRRNRGLEWSGGRKLPSLICYSAANAKCSEGQTQTITRESPTITQAPVHSKEKSPDLDDGGTGFPPRDDGDGGGGGGGGGGNWSGGFFFFGFLAFLGFLKDKEGEEDYRGSRR